MYWLTFDPLILSGFGSFPYENIPHLITSNGSPADPGAPAPSGTEIGLSPHFHIMETMNYKLRTGQSKPTTFSNDATKWRREVGWDLIIRLLKSIEIHMRQNLSQI